MRDPRGTALSLSAGLYAGSLEQTFMDREIALAPIVRAAFDLPPARTALEDTEPAKAVRGMKAISLRINFSTSIVLRARHAT